MIIIKFRFAFSERKLYPKKWKNVPKYFVRCCSSFEAGSVKNYVEKSGYSLSFCSDQFWDLPKFSSFHKTLKLISVCRSWNYYTSASSYHDYHLIISFKSVIVYRTIVNEILLDLVNDLINIRCHKNQTFTANVAPLVPLLSIITYPLLRLTRHRLQEHAICNP